MEVDISRGDVLVFIVLLAGSVAIGNAMLNQGWEPTTDVERYCVDLAATIESNISIGTPVEGCDCIPPTRVNESRFQAPDKVENATTLFLIRCRFTDGSEKVFPIRRILPNSSLNATNGTGTVVNGTNASVLD